MIVSKWSPAATALIIHDPGCMLEDHRGGTGSLALLVCAYLYVSERKRQILRADKETLGPEEIRDAFRRHCHRTVFLHALVET